MSARTREPVCGGGWGADTLKILGVIGALVAFVKMVEALV